MKDIQLNFIELVTDNFIYTVYRKLYDGLIKSNKDTKIYRLPKSDIDRTYQQYYVKLSPDIDYEIFEVGPETNRDLTKYILIEWIIKKANALNMKYCKTQESFLNTVEFYVDNFPEGERSITFSPYYLKTHKKYGYLVDIHFTNIQKDERINKNILRYTFSLDKTGNVNRSFYSDKYNFITKNLIRIIDTLNNDSISNDKFKIKESFTSTQVSFLLKKEYVFASGNEYSQYRGITKYKPYKGINGKCIFIFIIEDKYRAFANKLYLSLIGKQNPGTFAGMKQVFNIELSVSNIEKIRISDSSQHQIDKAINEVEIIVNQNLDCNPVVIYIEENDGSDNETISETYYYLKYKLTKLNIPSQVLSHEKINIESTLKWSTSNIGLALFTKLGGVPWLIKPSTNNCLILGIGSAHKIAPDGVVERYFAYSVCLDSSGLYKKLEVLADDHSEEFYLDALRNNLIKLLKSSDYSKYSKCALHLPFKIKDSEIKSLTEAISTVKEIEFKVIKINTKNKYFGYSFHNTKTPYESTLVSLNKSEYLIWFEGLQFGKENLNQRVSPPVHVEFLNVDNVSNESDGTYLQDIINLTGANWRGFNAKVKPISIYYSKIIANYCKHFEEFPDFRKEILSLDSPWFL